MSNSSLVTYTKISPNKSHPRNHVIDTISIHCMAGQLTVESCGNIFAKSSAQASSNYGIGKDGKIALYVDEGDRSWCTSNAANDNRAITIEVASDSTAPYAVTDAAYESLIKLLVDVCQRNNIKKLLWKGDKSLIGQVNKQNMTVHRWFKNKACPGDYLYNKHSEIADTVNAILTGDISNNPEPKPVTNDDAASVNMQVRIITDYLNVRTGPGTSSTKTGIVVKRNEVYTIVRSANGWGKLKSGAGWISNSPSYTEIINLTLPDKKTVYKLGTKYTLNDNMRVRKGPGTSYAAFSHSELSSAAKKKDSNKDGQIDKGTTIVCTSIQREGNNVWMKCSYGWIAAYYDKNIYIS